MYICYKDAKLYGFGDKEYMAELFNDWVVACDMYGQPRCEFEIVRVNDPKMIKTLIEGKEDHSK